jgi:hypothetical protein
MFDSYYWKGDGTTSTVNALKPFIFYVIVAVYLLPFLMMITQSKNVVSSP